MAENLMEALGFCLLIVFAYFVWPPLALLVSGLVFLLVANVRAARRKPARQGPSRWERLVQAWLASKADQR